MKKKRFIACLLSFAILAGCFIPTIGVLAANDWNFEQAFDRVIETLSGDKKVGDYSDIKPKISGDKLSLDDPKLAEKLWFEYVEYQTTAFRNEADEATGLTYYFYAPNDYSASSIMAIRDYNPDEIKGDGDTVGITWYDMVPFFESIAAANIAVGLSGGVAVAIYGGVTQAIEAATIGPVIGTQNIVKNSKYYSTPSFMGITRDDKWNGISNGGFYNCSSLSISMSKSSQVSVQKTNTVQSSYTIGGSWEKKLGAKAPLFASAETSLKDEANSALSYGINFQQSQNVQNSETVSRTFSRRNDDEVNNVGWKLCEYVVQVPYYVKGVDNEGNTVMEQYITYDLLQGVCGVYANGYIEHWSTGELVSYADFFEGFVTTDDLIKKAKETK